MATRALGYKNISGKKGTCCLLPMLAVIGFLDKTRGASWKVKNVRTSSAPDARPLPDPGLIF